VGNFLAGAPLECIADLEVASLRRGPPQRRLYDQGQDVRVFFPRGHATCKAGKRNVKREINTCALFAGIYSVFDRRGTSLLQAVVSFIGSSACLPVCLPVSASSCVGVVDASGQWSVAAVRSLLDAAAPRAVHSFVDSRRHKMLAHTLCDTLVALVDLVTVTTWYSPEKRDDWSQ